MDSTRTRVSDLRLDAGDTDLDVDVYNFLLENNLLHGMNPGLVASREQLGFMVAMEPGQVYVPCSDEIFFAIMREEFTPLLQREYRRVWRGAMRLLSSMGLSRQERRLLRAHCRKRLRKVLLFHDIVPSRLFKRLTSVLLTTLTPMHDPWEAEKRAAVAMARQHFASPALRRLLDEVPAPAPDGGMAAARLAMDRAEFTRLACLAAHARDWSGGLPGEDEVRRAFGEAWRAFSALPDAAKRIYGNERLSVLLLCDAEGGALQDLAMARFFIGRGHRVIYAVKDGCYHLAPTLRDMQEDPDLAGAVNGQHVCLNANLTKNELLRRLREWRLLVIGDGTRERLNFLRCSVTFARAWKEADVVLAHGWRLMETLTGTSHEFTRDLVCWGLDREDGRLRAVYKPRAAGARKFSEQDLQRHAEGIIDGMRRAHAEGRPVIFYSCIIGSIPGQTATAIRLATAITDDMRRRLPNAWIVNPAGHFVEGMDGDDLMYMWERVQRSGLISIWYFQTAEDIERGFALLGTPTPEVWTGKDATYSTGCTKEMHIALEVQRTNREMQILGPDPSSFFRRGEYGVGKYFDAALDRR